MRACVADAARTPFAWGRFDCCHFMGLAVEAQTGVDPMAQWGRYCSARAAGVLIAKAGCADLAAAVALTMARAGFAETKPAFAQRGDVALLPLADPSWPVAVGVVDLDGARVLAAGPAGLVRAARGDALRAWSLG